MTDYPITDRMTEAMLGAPEGEFYQLDPVEYEQFRKEFSRISREHPELAVTLNGSRALMDTIDSPIGVRLTVSFELIWMQRMRRVERGEDRMLNALAVLDIYEKYSPGTLDDAQRAIAAIGGFLRGEIR
jgi:hypothetical protein